MPLVNDYENLCVRIDNLCTKYEENPTKNKEAYIRKLTKQKNELYLLIERNKNLLASYLK